jgi:hypothetical protein
MIFQFTFPNSLLIFNNLHYITSNANRKYNCQTVPLIKAQITIQIKLIIIY